jgi:hypothetical protein
MRLLLILLFSITSSLLTVAQQPSAQPFSTGNITVTTAGGTGNKLAKFDSKSDITNSQIFDNGTNVGIGSSSPSTKLDVNGGATIRGSFFLPSTGAATHTSGKNSQALTSSASVFNSSTGTAVSQNFRWQAEPIGNNTPTATGSFSLLFSSGTNPPQETGLNINPNGQITFALGQGFPGTAQLSGGNTFTGSQTVSGNVTASAFSGDGSSLTNLQGANVQGSVASAVSSSFSTTATTASNALMLGGLPPSAYAPAGSQPAIVASVQLTNVNGGVPQTILLTPPQNGTYRVSLTVVGLPGCNSNPPAIVDLTWADDGGARGAAVPTSITPGLGTEAFFLRLNASSPLTYEIPDGNVSCTPYELYMAVEQLQ